MWAPILVVLTLAALQPRLAAPRTVPFIFYILALITSLHHHATTPH